MVRTVLSMDDMALRTTLFVSLALALAGGAPRADNKVDWSQYIDHDAKPTPSNPPPVVADAAKPAKPAKATKSPKKVAAKPKAKARRRH